MSHTTQLNSQSFEKALLWLKRLAAVLKWTCPIPSAKHLAMTGEVQYMATFWLVPWRGLQDHTLNWYLSVFGLHPLKCSTPRFAGFKTYSFLHLSQFELSDAGNLLSSLVPPSQAQWHSEKLCPQDQNSLISETQNTKIWIWMQKGKKGHHEQPLQERCHQHQALATKMFARSPSLAKANSHCSPHQTPVELRDLGILGPHRPWNWLNCRFVPNLRQFLWRWSACAHLFKKYQHTRYSIYTLSRPTSVNTHRAW